MSCGDVVAPSLGTVLLPAPRGPVGARGLGQRGVGWGRVRRPPTL